MSDDILAQRLAMVRQRLLDRTPATLNEARALILEAEAGRLDAAEKERAYIMIHNIAGTAGSVGMPAVTEAAKALDATLRPWLSGGFPEIPAWRAPFDHLAAALEAERSGVR